MRGNIVQFHLQIVLSNKSEKLIAKSAHLTQDYIHDGGIKSGVAITQFGVEYHGSGSKGFANGTFLGCQSGHPLHAVVIKQPIVFPNAVLKKKKTALM